MEDESSQAIKPEKVQSTPVEADISNQGHQSWQYTTDEKTRVATKTLELLQGTNDPYESPPKEEAYFGGLGLMDHIHSSQKRKKGLQSHQTMQQITADAPTSSMISVPIRTVPLAKVMVDDLVNFQLRPGSLNTLMAAIKGIGGKTSGTDGTGKDESRHGKKQPLPPDATRALMEITGKVNKRKAETSRAGSGEPSGEQQGTSQVTVVDLDQSDFAQDIHQVILSEPCYGLPLIAKDGGGSELNYSEAVKVQDFQGIYYFESGCLCGLFQLYAI